VSSAIAGRPCAGVRERLEALAQLEPSHPHGPDLARPARARRQAGRLEVEDDERRLLERNRLGGRGRDGDEIAREPEPGVGPDRLFEQRPRESDRDGPVELEDEAGGLVDRHRPTPLLHQLHETIGGIEAQLHAPMLVRTRVRV
jgi:hypothetical protein